LSFLQPFFSLHFSSFLFISLIVHSFVTGVFNLPDPSSRFMVPETSTKNLPAGKERPTVKAGILSVICEMMF
jgi:hypothetical protein